MIVRIFCYCSNQWRNHHNGSLVLSNSGLNFSNDIAKNNYTFIQKENSDFLFIEKTGFKNHLHIIGGGHVALALSALMSTLDFIFQCMKNGKIWLRLTKIHLLIKNTSVDSYSELHDLIFAGSNVYVAIMTSGYRTDDIALKALIQKELKYLGMLGSKKR